MQKMGAFYFGSRITVTTQRVRRINVKTRYNRYKRTLPDWTLYHFRRFVKKTLKKGGELSVFGESGE